MGRRADAVPPAEEAVTRYRKLAADNPGFWPDLAHALNNLGIRYSGVGRPADAVPPAEEAISICRELAADNPAFWPDLAGALNNLGTCYKDVGRPADAVPPTEEAVTRYRQLAADNPAFWPDLAMALGNLGICYSGVGRRADAVPPAEEAVTRYRELAADNPAFLPDLAGALNNLGIRYGAVGRHADAVPPTEEAVSRYRELAADNPAFLPDLAMALDNVGNQRPDAGLSWNADAAWSSALDVMPTVDLRIGLLLEKAWRATPRQAISDVLAAVAVTPLPSASTLSNLHSMCRELRSRDQELFDQKWQEKVGSQQPPWLLLNDVMLTTITEWLDTPTPTQARDYHRDHAEILTRPETRAALDELALAGFDPNVISQYRQLLDAASEQGIPQVHRRFVLAESLSTWLNADIPEKQLLLRENREMLLSDQAAQLLAQLSEEDPDNTMIRFSVALLSLAQEGLDSTVLAALEDPGQLNALLTDLLASDKPRQLQATTELLLCLDLDKPTLADAQFYLAIALAMAGHAKDAPERARAAARLDPDSVNRWINVLAGLVAPHPELATLIQALVSSRLDQPDGTSSSRQASPGP